jgi:uncharacterized protein
MNIIGRKDEIEQLQRLLNSAAPEFAVVYGRRRVGKTFLVNQFFGEAFTFKVTGLAKKDKAAQLWNFGEALKRQGSPLCPTPKNWCEAFDSLRVLLENSSSHGKKVVFIDELPYMYTPHSDLVVAIEHFWNDWGCTCKDLLLIVCGSATSWITKKILKNKGGLHNRVTSKIYLRPFNLSECKEYLISEGFRYEEKDILECYMIMGGIPYYLSLLEKELSLAQNVDRMFFRRKGKLDGEFDNLYASLFENSEPYIKVIDALSKRNYGMTRKEIIAATRIPDGGGLTTILSDLDDCDILRKYHSFGKKENDAIYQLTDFYTIFYYKFIKKYGTSDKDFWIYQASTPAHNAWAGIAFEQLCLYHHLQIEKKLGILGILTETFSWRDEDAQIDMVIKRADKVITLCEIKYWDSPYTITKKYRDELERKISSFRSHLKLARALHLTFISTYGLKANEYSGIVQSEVTMSDLFEKL